MIKQLSFITYNMITLKNIRENQDLISKKLKSKNFEVDKIEKLLKKDSNWRENLVLVEKLKEKEILLQSKYQFSKKKKNLRMISSMK